MEQCDAEFLSKKGKINAQHHNNWTLELNPIHCFKNNSKSSLLQNTFHNYLITFNFFDSNPTRP